MTSSIFKAHWECWDQCNLHCAFCYRMRETPLTTNAATRMLDNLATAGITQIVFAGGDPSLRSDIGSLIRDSRSLGMAVEVQTNAQLFTRVFSRLLDEIDLFGFSLDAGDAATHDALRGKAGNHALVLAAIDQCEAAKRPYIVRTVYSAENAANALAVGVLLEKKKHLKRWSIVEFSSIGDGYRNRGRFSVGAGGFVAAAGTVRARYPSLVIDSYANADKGGVYFLIKPNGDAYTTSTGFEGAEYASVGNVITDGVSICLARLSIDASAHISRYQDLL